MSNKLITISILCIWSLLSCASSKAQTKKESKAIPIYLEAAKEYRAGNIEKSISLCDKAIKKDPEFASTYSLKGTIYEQQGKLNESIKMFETAYQKSKNPKYLYFMGDVYYGFDKYKEASIAYRRALEDPRFNSMKKLTKAKAQKKYEQSVFAAKLASKPVPFNPINLGKGVNTDMNEYFPGVSIDQNYLFFTRLVNGQEDLYRSIWDSTTNTWRQATPLSLNTRSNEGTVSPTADGKYIFFTMCHTPQGFGSCDIFFSRIVNGIWTKPMLLQKPLNTPGYETQPCISADGKTIYFSSSRKPSYGGMDIFKSEFIDGKFQTPVNLGPKVNTKGNEQAPFIHADGRTMYFISDGHMGIGNNDIFITRMANDSWSTPENLGVPINTSKNELGIIVERTGKMAYYTSDREGGMGGQDLYSFILPKQFRPIASSYVSGLVLDAVTREKLASEVVLIDLKTGKEIANVTTKAKDGSFLIALPGERDYLLNVNNKQYLFYSDNFSLTTSTSENPYKLEVLLHKPKVGESVVLKNIFFDTDKYDLKNTSQIELDRLVTLLNRFSNLKIEIGGHTDNVGSVSANQTLSRNRAKEVMQYLISKGIAASRLTFKGYGESKPIASNETEAGRALNRRTEFKVVSNN
jgi:outer membrane protein OmpA-like peptidoglycan-associated protein